MEREAANQERDGPVPHATLRREIVGKFPIVAFLFFLNNPLQIYTNKANSQRSPFNQDSIPLNSSTAM